MDNVERARTLAKLAEHEGWKLLRELLEERKGKHLKRIASLLVARSEASVTQREIDYIAGFWHGAEWLLNNPDLHEQKLERALLKAQRSSEE